MQYHTAQSLQQKPENVQGEPSGTQQVQSPKKSKKGLVVILLMVVIGLIGGAGYIAYNVGKTDNEEDEDKEQKQSTTLDQPSLPYMVNDTGQTYCFDDADAIDCSEETEDYFGQDAQYDTEIMSFVDNGDGTTTDLNTGLMWQQDPGDKMDYDESIDGVKGFDLAGYDDWRVPTIKELYSLINFNGTDPSAETGDDTSSLTPYIDTDFFAFYFGDTSNNERIIDSQWVTSTIYEAKVMNGEECFFGVNFADGRIKCYPTRAGKGYFTIYVRGNTEYGINDFDENDDGTISDKATGLMWIQDDSGEGMTWEESLSYCEEREWAGYDDWRLPNAKELQSLVDYSRSPDTTESAAIDELFHVTSITNEADEKDYPFYWTGTTHISYPDRGQAGAYVAFGRSMGYMQNNWIDVHGAGSQRSDPKTGNPDDYPTGFGPQGDARRIYNYVRCVRSDDVTMVSGDSPRTIENSGNGSQPQVDTEGSPPQEAIAACNGKQENDDCSFQAPNETVTGECRTIDNELACAP